MGFHWRELSRTVHFSCELVKVNRKSYDDVRITGSRVANTRDETLQKPMSGIMSDWWQRCWLHCSLSRTLISTMLHHDQLHHCQEQNVQTETSSFTDGTQKDCHLACRPGSSFRVQPQAKHLDKLSLKVLNQFHLHSWGLQTKAQSLLHHLSVHASLERHPGKIADAI